MAPTPTTTLINYENIQDIFKRNPVYLIHNQIFWKDILETEKLA